MYRIVLSVSLFLALLSGCAPADKAQLDGELTKDLPEGLFAYIQTNKGAMVARLEYDRAPLTVANFVGLAEGSIENTAKQMGEPYFDDMLFHRVVNNFVLQVGDPNTLEGGNPSEIGRGGPGYSVKDEIHPDLKHNVAGTLSMANFKVGTNSNGSQFFITHRPTPNLDGGYSVFGYVIRGLKTVYMVAQNDTLQAVRIIRQGPEAAAFDAAATFKELN